MRSAFGPVSNSRLNVQRGDEHNKLKASRMSLGGPLNSGRPSMGGKKAAKSRHSMMPTAASRRKSTMGRQSIGGMNSRRTTMGGNAGLKSDPRPLTDKSFMHQQIRNLIRFLANHNYEQSLSPKLLLRPTGKDFQNIVHFLFTLVDPNYRLGQKFIDEVPVMYKGLCYPFNISKTALSAVGSPHTWPALLGSLTWLIELLEYDEQKLELDESDGSGMFFHYLREAYQCFLCGDDETYEQLDMEMVSYYQARDDEVKNEIDECKMRKDKLERDLKDLKGHKSLLPTLKQRKRDYKSDILKFQQLIQKLVDHKASLEAKTREYENELHEKKLEQKEAERIREQFQLKLDAQEISPTDVERMNLERRRIDEALNQVQKERETIQQDIWDLEMQLAKKTEEFEAAVKSYNAAGARLKLVPSGAQNAQGVDFEMKLDMGAYFQQQSMISVDLKNVIRPALHELKEIAIRKTHEYRNRSLELQAQVDKNDEERGEKDDKIQEIESKLKKADDQYQYEKDVMDRQLQTSALDTEAIEAQIHDLRTQVNMNALLEASVKDLNQLTTMLSENKTSFRDEQLKLEDEIHRSLDAIVEHKQFVESQLHRLKQGYTTGLEEANQLVHATKQQLTEIASA